MFIIRDVVDADSGDLQVFAIVECLSPASSDSLSTLTESVASVFEVSSAASSSVTPIELPIALGLDMLPAVSFGPPSTPLGFMAVPATVSEPTRSLHSSLPPLNPPVLTDPEIGPETPSDPTLAAPVLVVFLEWRAPPTRLSSSLLGSVKLAVLSWSGGPFNTLPSSPFAPPWCTGAPESEISSKGSSDSMFASFGSITSMEVRILSWTLSNLPLASSWWVEHDSMAARNDSIAPENSL